MKPVKVDAGKVLPWFNEEGGGIQYELPEQIKILIKKGIIKETME